MIERQARAEATDGLEAVRAHFPIIHALLPAQDESTYRRFFNCVREVRIFHWNDVAVDKMTSVLQLFPELRPTRFKSDYQVAVIEAVRKAFPGISCEGDSFHMVQAVMKQLGKHGLRGLYNQDLAFYHQVSELLIGCILVGPSRHLDLGTVAAHYDVCAPKMRGGVLVRCAQANGRLAISATSDGVHGKSVDRQKIYFNYERSEATFPAVSLESVEECHREATTSQQSHGKQQSEAPIAHQGESYYLGLRSGFEERVQRRLFFGLPGK